VEYETEEQQVEALKEWWRENGKAVITGVVLGVAVIGGWTLWQKRGESQAIAASDGYSLAMEAVEAGDGAEAYSLADKLKDDQPNSLYASYANLAEPISLHMKMCVLLPPCDLPEYKVRWVMPLKG